MCDPPFSGKFILFWSILARKNNQMINHNLVAVVVFVQLLSLKGIAFKRENGPPFCLDFMTGLLVT